MHVPIFFVWSRHRVVLRGQKIIGDLKHPLGILNQTGLQVKVHLKEIMSGKGEGMNGHLHRCYMPFSERSIPS